MKHAHERKLSDEGDAVRVYMREETENCVYSWASPSSLLPVMTNTIIVSGTEDCDVPVDMTRDFVERVREKEREREKEKASGRFKS
mmetsp:Transcript_7285/g.7507  ORF Transcript_7285/g.7507 Transcript_7285/m.7507 type:complete len:86 (+) Transcript_7285:2-259(+)